MRPSLSCLRRAALCLLGVSCVQYQRPYQFTTPTQPDSVDAVSRALAMAGHPVAEGQREAGALLTRWEEAGAAEFERAGATASLQHRYLVTLKPVPGGDQVTVREESQRCAGGSAAVAAGPCEPLSGILPAHQKSLDALGAALAVALSNGSVPVGSHLTAAGPKFNPVAEGWPAPPLVAVPPGEGAPIRPRDCAGSIQAMFGGGCADK